MKAKLLNLEEALQMYELIREFLPTEPTTQIKAIHTMVTNMGMGNYFKCLELMTGESRESLVHISGTERLAIFIVGFQENFLFDLPKLKAVGLYD